MKFPSFPCLILLTTLIAVRADDTAAQTPFLRSFILSERTAFQIPVTLHQGLTTLVFPEAPQNLAAARIAFVEAGQAVPDFTNDDRVDFVVLTHRGSTSCSIRALRSGAHDTLSVFLGGKVYQLFLRAEETNPLLTVEFHRESAGTLATASVSPNRLIDCLTRAKAYPVLARYYPNELQDITHVVSNRVTSYLGFRVQISEIFRFDLEDTLVFHVLLENLTAQPIEYKPAELAVRVVPQTPNFLRAPPLYEASIVDASALILPRGVTTAWFAITGTRNGGRNELDPSRNIFKVLVSRSDFPSQSTSTGQKTQHAESAPDPKEFTTH